MKQPALATFAGGCFWCIESAFKYQPGVIAVTSGYAGGTEENPSYEMVCSGKTQYVEAVQVLYDPLKTDYETLVRHFWIQIDPTDPDGQFADRGQQYRTAIFYHNDDQKQIAEKVKEELAVSMKYGKPIVTMIKPFTTFSPAEDYHQDYSQKHSDHYQRYYKGSGREDFVNQQKREHRL